MAGTACNEGRYATPSNTQAAVFPMASPSLPTDNLRCSLTMRARMLSKFLCLLTISTASAGSITNENVDELTDGKAVFIKFRAPWCGHCKKLKPDWDWLSNEYANHPTKLIADVDCTTTDGTKLCKKYGVTGYPTLKYGTDMDNLMTYDGKHTRVALAEHVEDKLVVECGPSNIDLCDDATKEKIQSYVEMPFQDLTDAVRAVDISLADSKAEFNEKLQALQRQYTAILESHDEQVKATEDSSDIRTKKLVHAKRRKEQMKGPPAM